MSITQLEYAALQHDLCCKHLGINPNHDEPGDTLLEAICKIEIRLAEHERESRLEQSDYILP